MREPRAIFFAIEQRQHFLKGDRQLYHLQTSQRFDASARHLSDASARHLSSTFLNIMPIDDTVQ